MRAHHAAALALAVAACGRFGFAGGATGDSTVGDATADAVAISGLTKLTVDAPLLDSPSPTSGDCGEFLEERVSDDTMAGDLMPYAALANDNATLWFAYSCKYSDVGWSETIGSWVPPTGAFQVYDGEPENPGINEFVDVNATMADGQLVSSVRALRFAFAADDSVVGIGSRLRPSDSVTQVMPVVFATPLALSPASYDFDHVGVFDPPAEPWAVTTGTGRDILRVGSTYYLYSVHWDGVTMTATGVPLTSIAVATTTDMQDATFGPSPLVTGWADPSVAAWGGSYHMIARDLSTNSYSYVHGTAPDQWDFANATPLGLATRAGAPGAWDNLNYIEHGLSGDPRVTTARVVDGVFYIFYAAGVPPSSEAAAKGGDSKRGVGVFALPLGD